METTNCTFLVSFDKAAQPSQAEVQADLESADVARKVAGVKKCIQLILAGEDMTKLLMFVIRFCITVEDHEVKKLLMYFWEVVKKYDASGKLKPEMILVCNALRNDLNHPNEFIRGCTLRFLCKLKEQELLEPLVASVKQCLTHRHHYVRRQAVMTMYNMYKNFGPDLVPDAPQDILAFIQEESDASARRNAFLMLFNCAQDIAVDYYLQHADETLSYGDGFQLVVLELTRKVCRTDPSKKSHFIKCIFQLLTSASPAVVFEAAGTVVALSTAPTAIRAAAQAYTQLLNKESDNNVKLIVLERLNVLKKAHPRVMREVVMDILRALSSPNEDIQRKTLDIAMALVSPRNVEEVMGLLKKEILKTQANASQDSKANKVYREMLIKAIHSCGVKFPDIAHSVVLVLMDFLGSDGAAGVIAFVREIVEGFPDLRASVLTKLYQRFGDIEASEVARVALWILGQYCDDAPSLHSALSCIKECLGPLPLFAPISKAVVEEDAVSVASEAKSTRPTVLSDGTYATQSAVSETDKKADAGAAEDSIPGLRKLLQKGDFFLGSVIASTLTKLALRTQELHGEDSRDAKAVLVGCLLVMCAVIELGQSGKAANKIDQDSFEHIVMCIRVLADPLSHSVIGAEYRSLCRASFHKLIDARRDAAAAAGGEEEKKTEAVAQADDLIAIRQLRGRRAATAVEVDLDDEADITKATGATDGDFASRMKRVHQLSGFADTVYCEAQLTVHEYDIVLDILVVNRTDATMTNVSVELFTMGDLKLVERPQSFNLGPQDSKTIRANIKVSSTESGEVFGTIVYDAAGSADKNTINLSGIKIDILDYIQPATCTDAAFRAMWADFEWENKVAVNTPLSNLQEFVEHIVKSTNMRCLTPIGALDPHCNFLAANLYAKSIFGEDALVNVSVENRADSSIKGHIRIRSKTQGVALSLGDKITDTQRRTKKGAATVAAPLPAAPVAAEGEDD